MKIDLYEIAGSAVLTFFVAAFVMALIQKSHDEKIIKQCKTVGIKEIRSTIIRCSIIEGK